ncbi:MAG: hypothetical protein NZ989_00250 [Bacteroidia bacterium]|nr:hypothetical protein [Bacteroidia bacterium]
MREGKRVPEKDLRSFSAFARRRLIGVYLLEGCEYSSEYGLSFTRENGTEELIL